MKQYIIFKLAFLTLLVFLGACKKVININLNSASPRYVVQGNITDQPGPYLVAITKTVNFDQDNVFPPVSGATVVITDKTANTVDTLKEITPGNYYTKATTGVSGHTYSLYVNAGNNVFTASSTMPAPVVLDSLYTQAAIFGNNKVVIPIYTDPVATGNYYQFVIIRNDTITDNINVRNDALINGQVIRIPLNGGDLMPGDSATVYLQCIDSAIYQYYFTLEQTENQNSATPANPLTNITGGSLGYFSAQTLSQKSIIVP